MSRRPLSARNVDYPVSTGGKAKKERCPFGIIERGSLASFINMIVAEAGLPQPVTVSEDDLLHPTADKLQHVYAACLHYLFDVSPDALKQTSFHSYHIDYPELLEDFTYRIQFFRILKRCMQSYLVTDLKMEDILNPEPRRTVRNLSAIVNFISFHFSCFENDASVIEYNEATDTAAAQHSQLQEANYELHQQLTALESQRREDQELEEELRRKIGDQMQHMESLKLHEITLRERCNDVSAQKEECDERLACLALKLEKRCLRNEDLKRQVVSSPDKLKARLAQLQSQMEDARVVSKQSEKLLRMWEALASRAQQVPVVIKGLNEYLDALMAKAEKRSDLKSHLDGIREHISLQQQSLREAAAKHQNLLRHLKLVEDESNQVVYEGRKPPLTNAAVDLQRDVYLLEQEVRGADESQKHKIEREKAELSEQKQLSLAAHSLLFGTVKEMETTMQQRFADYKGISQSC